MNIPAQDLRNVVTGVGSALAWLSTARRTPLNEKCPAPAAVGPMVGSPISLHGEILHEAPFVVPHEQRTFGQQTMQEAAAATKARRWPSVARLRETVQLTAKLKGHICGQVRRQHQAASYSTVSDWKPWLETVPVAAILGDEDHSTVPRNKPAMTHSGYTTVQLRGTSSAGRCPGMADDEKRPCPLSPLAASDAVRADCDERELAVARHNDGGQRGVSWKCPRYDSVGASRWFLNIVDPRGSDGARQEDSRKAPVACISELGEMAAALAHEINQPLTAILSNAQAAQRFLDFSPSDLADLREALADIVADSFRATEIVRKLRELVRRGAPETGPLDVGALVRSVTHLMRRNAAARGASVTLNIAAHVPMVRGDNIQLQQVMINLLQNAFDAVEGRCAEDRVVSVKISTAPRGDGVSIAISDRGPGVEPGQVGEVFKPFSTSKPHGLGLGLSISSSIVSMHGGRLSAENNLDGGATFRILLPLASDAQGSDPR